MFSADVIAADARQLLIFAAGERGWNDSRDAWLERASRRLGVKFRRARALFYGERIKLGADEYLSICSNAASLPQRIAQEKAAEDDLAHALARARAALAFVPVPSQGDGVAEAVRAACGAGRDAGAADAETAESVRRG